MTQDPSSDIGSAQKAPNHRRQPKTSNAFCSPAHGNTSDMDNSSINIITAISGSTSIYPQVADDKSREIELISRVKGYESQIQNLTDTETTSHGLPLSMTAFGTATTEINDDNIIQNYDSTKSDSPLQTALTKMNDMCRGLGQQDAAEHQSPQGAVSVIVMNAPPVSAPTQVTATTKKSWIRNACGTCIEAKHISYHQNICGTVYRGKTRNCRQKECRKMLSALWQANFSRSDDCHHSTKGLLSKETSPVSEPLIRSVKPTRTQSRSTAFQNKISKPKHNAARTSCGKFTKRAGQLNNTCMAEQLADSKKSGGIFHKPFELSQPAPNGSFHLQAIQRHVEAHEASVTVSAEVLSRLSAFNIEALETYPGRRIPEGFVEKNWLLLARSISAYDYFVRGVTSNAEVRTKLEVLDTIAPLSDLPQIRQEVDPLGKLWHQSTPLLQALKGLCNVPMQTCLRSGISLSSGQIRRLNFSRVLRATLAYILHQEVFSSEENGPLWKTVERCLTAVYGQREASATLQLCRLETLRLDSVKACLESRSQQLAELIYVTLLPLSHWVEDSPNNDKAKHLELLEKITHQSIHLANDLQAREGTFEYIWPKYGMLFNPDFCSVDGSQEDDIRRMDYETKKKQVIAFTLMPIVQSKILNEERALPYARGVVLLKEPYVDYHH